VQSSLFGGFLFMSDYLYVKHDHYHHIVNPNQSPYTSNDGDDSYDYDDSPSSTDSSSDTSSYTDNDTTSDNTYMDANHNGQCSITEMSQPDHESCYQDNGIIDASSYDDNSAIDSNSDCGSHDSGSDCGSYDSGSSDDSSSD
jgi:hypothetical protein